MMKWLLLLVFLPIGAHAQGVQTFEPIAEFRSEGSNPVDITTSCASGSWTMIVSSDTIRRSIVLYAPNDNSATPDAICIAHTNLGSATCSGTQVGVELTAGSSLTDYTTSSLWCRPRTTTANIKGVQYRDKRDYGSIGAARNQ